MYDLVKCSGMGKRGLQRLFSEYVGVSPKWVIRTGAGPTGRGIHAQRAGRGRTRIDEEAQVMRPDDKSSDRDDASCHC